MLIRICLVIAILAGVATGALNFVKVKEKITTLQTNLKTETEAHQKFEKDYNVTKNALEKTNAVLKVTQETLKATTEEKEAALANAAKEKQRGDKLTEDLAKTRGERDDAQTQLAAYKATGMNPDQIFAFDKTIKGLQTSVDGLQNENRIIAQKLKRTENELAVFKDKEYSVPLPPGLLGKVLVSDPKWQFVVLNVGEDQGVLKDGELLINRNGKLVAKVKISSVQKDRSVANIEPGWQVGDVYEGDLAIPAHPAS
ncbi:MAG TPA: hypothetical protein VLT36_19360 [Candidatus Dormibacteraeota bacterium]|nr:hypothetical protein [Candidatus Dormibacteraeota bacterium]